MAGGAVVLAGAALAQQPVREILADLDGDGRAEAYALRDSPGGGHVVDLIVIDGPATVLVAELIHGSQAGLALGPDGTLEVRASGGDPARDGWSVVFVLAWHDGDLRFVGQGYGDAYKDGAETRRQVCEANLITGRVTVTGDGRGAFRIPGHAGPATLRDWAREDFERPEACFVVHELY